MAEMASVPASWFAIFDDKNLPADPAKWPQFVAGKAMPMSGKFLIRAADLSLTACEDGFLTVGGDGFPKWQATIA